MPRYRVTAPGYWGKTLHKPGHPRHGFVITDKPIKPVPSWLKLVKAETPAEKKTREDQAATDAKQVAGDKQEISDVSFMGGVESGKTVKTI